MSSSSSISGVGADRTGRGALISSPTAFSSWGAGSSSVPIPTACLISPNAPPNENPAFAAGASGASGASGSAVAGAASPSPTPGASPSPATGFLGGFAHRRERRRRRRACDLRAEGNLVLPVVEPSQGDEAAARGFDDEFAEPREPGVLLVEVRVDLLHHLLHAVGAHDVVVRRHLLL